MNRSHLRGTAITAAKVVVSAGLIAFALRGIDSRTVLEQLRNVEMAPVAATIVLVTAISLLHARRWEVVLGRMEHRLPFAEALKLVLIGYFFNQTLPSTVGGDAYRAWGAYKRGIHAGNAVASVLVDRIFALIALIAMIVAGSWWLFQWIPPPGARMAFVAIIAGGAIGFAVLLALPRFGARLRRWRATRLLLHVAEGARAVTSSAAATLEVVLLTVAGYAAISYAVYQLADALGVNLALGHALLFVPLVTLVTVLPVSIAGWGLRESAMVVALDVIGVPAVQAFSLSVLYGLVVMASGVPGGILWLAARRHNSTTLHGPARPHGSR
jgi:hypothetical protein